MASTLTFTTLRGYPMQINPCTIKGIYYSPERDCTVIRALKGNVLIRQSVGQTRGMLRRWMKDQQLTLNL